MVKAGDRDLSDVLAKIYEGKIAVPNFQRKFIWNRQQVEDLLVSVTQDYFMGTLLFLTINPSEIPFSPMLIEGVKEAGGSTDCLSAELILDGQQRLTSLFYAAYAPPIALKSTSYPYRFYLDLKKALHVINGNTDVTMDDAIFSSRWKKYEDTDLQHEECIIPFTELFTISKFENWIRGYTEFLGTEGKDVNYETIDEYRDLRRRFDNYKVTVVNLSQHDENLMKIVEIFERVNSKGTGLSIFELLTSRFYDTVNLRELWDDCYEKNELIKQFATDEKDDKFPRFILQVIALIRSRECKKKALFNLERDNLKTDWEYAEKYIEMALTRLKETASGGYGVISVDLMPYTTMIPPLAAVLFEIDKKGKSTADIFEKIHRWYWASVFFNWYERSTDARAYSDVKDLKAWFEDDTKTPTLFTTFERDFEREGKKFDVANWKGRLVEESSRGSAIYKGVISLLVLNGPLDFFHADTIELHKLDDHHIFPVAMLKKSDYPNWKINSIINRTLITSKTNKGIKDKPPSKYLLKMEETLGGDSNLREVLKSHFIDDQAYEAMKKDDYESFLEAREKVVLEEIFRRCGFPQDI